MSEALREKPDIDELVDVEESLVAEPNLPAETFGVCCPSCGGSIRIHEGQRSVKCRYCGSALFVTRPRGVRSFMMKPKITPGKARLIALHHLADETEGRIKARHAAIVDLQLVNVPFWRMHGRLMGWVTGEKSKFVKIEVPSNTPNGPRTIKTTREERYSFSKLVFKHVDWSSPACTLPYLGLQGISLRTKFLDWDIFDHKYKTKDTFALPMKNAKQAENDAFSYLTKLATPAGSTMRASRFQLFGSNFSLYYYPVYFIRYRHGGRIYTITIDGMDGRVTRGDTPRRIRMNAKPLFLVPAAFAFLAATWFPLALIGAAAVYAFDMIQSAGFMAPHIWARRRLGTWFGSEEK